MPHATTHEAKTHASEGAPNIEATITGSKEVATPNSGTPPGHKSLTPQDDEVTASALVDAVTPAVIVAQRKVGNKAHELGMTEKEFHTSDTHAKPMDKPVEHHAAYPNDAGKDAEKQREDAHAHSKHVDGKHVDTHADHKDSKGYSKK